MLPNPPAALKLSTFPPVSRRMAAPQLPPPRLGSGTSFGSSPHVLPVPPDQLQPHLICTAFHAPLISRSGHSVVGLTRRRWFSHAHRFPSAARPARAAAVDGERRGAGGSGSGLGTGPVHPLGGGVGNGRPAGARGLRGGALRGCLGGVLRGGAGARAPAKATRAPLPCRQLLRRLLCGAASAISSAAIQVFSSGELSMS